MDDGEGDDYGVGWDGGADGVYCITVVFYKSSVCCGILQCSVYSICGIFF